MRRIRGKTKRSCIRNIGVPRQVKTRDLLDRFRKPDCSSTKAMPFEYHRTTMSSERIENRPGFPYYIGTEELGCLSYIRGAHKFVSTPRLHFNSSFSAGKQFSCVPGINCWRSIFDDKPFYYQVGTTCLLVCGFVFCFTWRQLLTGFAPASARASSRSAFAVYGM